MNDSINIDIDVYTELVKKNVKYETLKNLLINNIFISNDLLYSLFGMEKKKD